MLQLFRSGLTSYFATALLGLLIASFALWGIGGDVLTGAGSNVAQIGDDKLTLNEYAREFQNKFTEMQQQSGGEITREMVIDQGMANKWLTDLVQRETFAYAAHNLHIRVTDAQLRDFIMNIEAFQDTFGEFSKDTFKSIANYRGLSTGEFEEFLRRDLERQYLITSVVSGISVPETLQKTFTKYLMEERTAEIITIPADNINDIPEPDEETLKAYYKENSSRYMAPEYRDFRFITLSAKGLANEVTVTEEEITATMGKVAEASGENEKRDFDQLLFDDKDGADKAYADLKAGRDFGDIILASGSTPEDAAVVENSMQDATDTYGIEAAEAIFTAKEGDYTAPVETDFGWRIFNITKTHAAVNDKNKIREETRKRLLEEKALDILYTKSDQITDELAAGGSLTDIASALNLDLKEAHNVDKFGYNAKGDLVIGLPTGPTFLTKVFDALEEDEPQLEEMDNGEYFLVVVDNVQERALRPFEDVKTSVIDLWKADAREEEARKHANEILAKAEEGASLEDMAKSMANMAYTSVTLARNDPAGKVAAMIHENIFALNVGESKIIPAADNNGFVVVRVQSRKLPDDSLPEAQSAQLKDLMMQEYQQRFMANYWRYLETSLPVIINQRGVKAVHDQLASREQ
ncbi:MAG: hypothetical protein GXP00_05805 [Alphaproteobacteria bacterium]|nr:hypothetical protein [Alphaproteobacteria bacterium]